MVYNDPSDRTSFEARALEAFVVSWAQLHYRCLLFWLPGTKGFQILVTYKLYPAHCRLPVISENNETLITAQDMLKAYKQLMGKRTVDKIAHTRLVQRLSDIICNRAPRTAQQQPVLAPATSSDPTGPPAIQKLRPVHNMKTCSNTSMPTSFITEEPVATS